MAAKRHRQGGDACSAMLCSNARYKKDCGQLSFFRFPRDDERCARWVQNSRRQDLHGKTAEQLNKGGYLLCSKHFEASQFTVPSEKKRLNWNAVPTIFEVPNPPPRLTPRRPPPKKRQGSFEQPAQKRRNLSQPESQPNTEGPHQAEAASAPVPDPLTSAREAALQSKLKVMRNRLYRLKQKVKRTQQVQLKKVKDQERKAAVLKELADFLPKKTVDFIATQLRAVGRKKKGVRWNDNDKALALSLFHSSPKAYRRLKRFFLLPSVSTLRRILKNVDIYPGCSDRILNALSLKLKSLPAGSEHCALIFDEMNIKENVSYDENLDRIEGLEDFGPHGRSRYAANHALVFMVRGLRTNWKQPFAYFLSSGPIYGNLLPSLICHCINRVEEVGLNVKVVVADQSSNNRNAFSVGLGVTEEEPFFKHKGKRIYVIFDPPHLLKNVRNNLKKTGFTVNNKTVCWDHIVEFYRFDKKNRVRMAPSLRERHISLPAFSTLKVRYAAQVLSHSVAAGISTVVQLGVLTEDALATSAFIEHIDQLFNAFNSGGFKSRQIMGHALSSKSGHTVFLQDSLSWLDTVKTNSSRSLPCLSGWKMAIRSVLALWEDLQKNHGFKFLLTDRLNQDCLENLFSRIRRHAGGVYNPTPAAFRAILKQVMIDQIFDHTGQSNCLEDSAKFLIKADDIRAVAHVFSDDRPAEHSLEEACVTEPGIISTSQPQPKNTLLQKAEDNVMVYIAGYIAKKIVLKVCESCACMLTGVVSGKENELFLVNKQYRMMNLERKGLTVPSSVLLQAVQRLEAVFVTKIDSILPGDSVKACLVKALHPACEIVCPEGKCTTKQFVIKKYINVRLHSTLKDINETFSQKGGKRNMKTMQHCYN